MPAGQLFDPDPARVTDARHFVSATLADWGVRAPDAALLVSELATNAVLHARSEFEVTIYRHRDRVRIEVFDHNTRLPAFAVVPADAYSGRGLMLVQALAWAWGVETHPDDGKTIWFEVTSERVSDNNGGGKHR